MNICQTSRVPTCIRSEMHVQSLRNTRAITQKCTCIHSDFNDVQSLRSLVIIGFPAKRYRRQVVLHLVFQVVCIHVAEKHYIGCEVLQMFFSDCTCGAQGRTMPSQIKEQSVERLRRSMNAGGAALTLASAIPFRKRNVRTAPLSAISPRPCLLASRKCTYNLCIS